MNAGMEWVGIRGPKGRDTCYTHRTTVCVAESDKEPANRHWGSLVDLEADEET